MAGREPEDRPPREALTVDPAEIIETPISERQGEGVELGAVIDSLMLAVPEQTAKIATDAVNIRSQLISRRLHGSDSGKQRFINAIITTCNEIGITPQDYEAARLLVTVPLEALPLEQQADRMRVRREVIDKVDNLVKQDIANFDRFFPDAISHRADLYEISYEYAEARERLSNKRNEGRDSLTGLINDQGYLSEVFDIELKLLTLLEENRAMLVIRIDLDNFKRVNDTFGHEEGDRVLIEFAKNLNDTFGRSFDIVSVVEGETGVGGRPGGDEFLVIVNGINMEAWVHVTDEDIEHYPADFLKQEGIGNKVLFSIARKIRECAKRISAPDGTTLGASVGMARVHQEEAMEMLYGTDRRYAKMGFSEYNRRADEAAIWAKEWGDGVIAEWGPRLSPVPQTFERLLAKAKKRFSRDNKGLVIDSEIEAELITMARLLERKYKELNTKKTES